MSRPSFCKCEDWPCCGCGHEASQGSQHEAALELEDDLREMNDLNGEPDEDDGMTDAEADADTLRSAGWGPDENYNVDTPLGDFYGGE